ncbi:tetratricopeptide repeat protein [Hyalangium versicolor]|uniref:tetratricopeptide repeat protein n=1 Tax=Hyalangium versicolor TaxID=2861190 RepID=UPI001CCDF981|nr:tetratricopeptide repeat protein [Hyalangium versicolor]
MSTQLQAKVSVSKKDVPPELAQKLFLGEITPGQFLGMSTERLYKLAGMGHEMFKSGQLQGARDVFEGLVAASPYDSVFHCHLAATYARLERFEEAKASYTRSLELNIANVDALVGRSELYLRERQLAEALQDIQQALKLDPQATRDTTKRARATLQMLQKMAEGGKAA